MDQPIDLRCPNCAHHLKLARPHEMEELSCPSCGSRISIGETIPETISIHAKLPSLRQFDLRHELGSGQFGSVWKAYDNVLDRVVAIKIPHRDNLTASDTEFILREARTAGQLEHPNIVTVYEVGKENDAVYIISQYIDGITMSDWKHVNRVDAKKTAEYMATICDAIDYAHEKGIVHRDLKPTNVLVDREGTPFITDFGLAKRDHVEATIAVDGRILGTPAYMSPEQARGEGQLADRRSDVYSLGVMLYELLTDRRPFNGGSRLLLHQVIHDSPKSPRSISSAVPKDLDTICMKALEKEPTRRYQTAAEMAADLNNFLDGKPIEARPIGWMEKATRYAKREPVRVLATAFGSLTLILSLSLVIALFARPDPDEDRADPNTNTQTVNVKTPPERSRQVIIETSPQEAQVVFYPLDVHGTPILEDKVRRGEYDGETWLLPGYYFVVAYVDNELFHEVYRFVPAKGESSRGYNHTDFVESDEGVITMHPITLFDQTAVVESMVKVDEGMLDFNDETSETISTFYVDSTEFPDPNREAWPLVSCTWYKAVDEAEAVGKRLLRDEEFTYLATAGGAQRFPWGNDPPEENLWVPAPLGDNETDILDWAKASDEVKGLFSNRLEWSTKFVAAPGLAFESRFVYGGPTTGPIDEATFRAALVSDRDNKMTIDYIPEIGFRCARSSRPSFAP